MEFNNPKSIELFSKYELKTLKRLEALSFTDRSHSYNGVPCKRFLGASSRGYGQISFLGEMIYVHRVSAHLFFDFNISGNLDICHHCDVKNCWEPLHLFSGVQKDNSIDAAQKGIFSKTSHNGHKTHCPQGHEYTPENTLNNQGSRVCRICNRQRGKINYNKSVEKVYLNG